MFVESERSLYCNKCNIEISELPYGLKMDIHVEISGKEWKERSFRVVGSIFVRIVPEIGEDDNNLGCNIYKLDYPYLQILQGILSLY